jgi:hypothetical protein
VNGDSLNSFDISTEQEAFSVNVPAQTVDRQGLLEIESRALTALYNHVTLEVSHED